MSHKPLGSKWFLNMIGECALLAAAFEGMSRIFVWVRNPGDGPMIKLMNVLCADLTHVSAALSAAIGIAAIFLWLQHARAGG